MKNETKTSGLKLLELVWENNQTEAWESLNHSMHSALYLVIGAKLEFSADDIWTVNKTMSVGHWLGEHMWEYPYAFAIAVGNMEFVKAFEEWSNRKPFFANNVNPGNNNYGYTHSTGQRQRERLALGSEIGSWLCTVTSIRQDYVIITSYKDNKKNGRKVERLTREDLAIRFPAKKKAKVDGGEQTL